MRYKKSLKKFVPFVFFFSFGVLSTTLFTPCVKKEIKQETLLNFSSVSSPKKLSVCRDKNTLNIELYKLKKWFSENENSPKHKKLSKVKEIEKLEAELDAIRKSEESENNSKGEKIGKNVVLRQNCY